MLERQDGLIFCRLEGGLKLWIKTAEGGAIGSKMLVSVRPEKIRLFRERPEGDRNVFDSRVSSEVFKGAVDDMTIVTEGGLELSALLANAGETGLDFHEGENVWCLIHPNDVSLLVREQASAAV